MKEEKTKSRVGNDIKMSMTRMKARKIKKKRMTILCVVFAVFFLLIVTALSVMFLKVNEIRVEGNIKYTEEEILAICGIKKGESILSVNKGEISEKIKKNFPAVNSVQIKKSLPSTVKISVKESEEILFVAFGEHYYSLDLNLRVTEKYDSIDSPEIFGMKRIYMPGVKRCITGEMIETEDDDIPGMVLELCENLVKYDMFNSIDEIDFRDKFNITFNIGVKYTVKFGNILECSTKLEILDGIINKVGMDYIGTIDLSSGNIKEVTMSAG